MLKYSTVIALVLSGVLTGCISTTVNTSPEGVKTTSTAVRGCNNPSQTITRVETPGKPDITFGSTGSDLCNTIAAAAIGAAGQIVASSVLPGSAINVSSGSVNETNTSTNVQTSR